MTPTAPEWESSGHRLLYFPDETYTESDYAARRRAKRTDREPELSRKLYLSESLSEVVAERLDEAGIDPRPLLEHVKQPCEAVGIGPRDLFEVSQGSYRLVVESEVSDVTEATTTSEVAFPLELDQVEDIRDICHEGPEQLNCDEIYEPDYDPDERGIQVFASLTDSGGSADVCKYLVELSDFCESALEMELRPRLKRTV